MAGEPFEPPAGFTLLDSRKYGKARIEILRSLVLAGPNGTLVIVRADRRLLRRCPVSGAKQTLLVRGCQDRS